MHGLARGFGKRICDLDWPAGLAFLKGAAEAA
jgi:hypothetical protein